MSGEYGDSTLTMSRLGAACLVGAAMWAVIIWTVVRWYNLLT